MKLELEINSANFGQTIEGVFKSLTDAERKELARSVLAEFLQRGYPAERLEKEREVIAKVRAEYQWLRDQTDEAIRYSSECKEAMRNYKSVSEKMIEGIATTANEHVKDLTQQMVKDDPQIQTVMQAVLAQIKEQFPNYVRDAVINHFAAQMNIIRDGLLFAKIEDHQAQNQLKALQSHLQARGLM